MELQVPVHCKLGHACVGALTQCHDALAGGRREVGRAGRLVVWEGSLRGWLGASEEVIPGRCPVTFCCYAMECASQSQE